MIEAIFTSTVNENIAVTKFIQKLLVEVEAKSVVVDQENFKIFFSGHRNIFGFTKGASY
jgi:hypothetical protein